MPQLSQVLNLAGATPVLQSLIDVGSASKRPFVCESDIAVRVNVTAVAGSSQRYGKLVSYTAPSVPEGRTVCTSEFTAHSGNVACKQLGFDSGRATAMTTQPTAMGKVGCPSPGQPSLA